MFISPQQLLAIGITQLLLCIALSCTAQLPEADEVQQKTPSVGTLNEKRLNINVYGMSILGGWALLNIGSGVVLRSQTTGETRYFHEMNALWNTVNLALAGVGFYTAMNTDPYAQDLQQSLQEQAGIQKLLLFNAGLDVGYIMTGLWLRERGKRNVSRPERLRGWGSGLILQGGFLLVFDATLAWLHARNDELYLQLTETAQLQPLPGGVALVW